MPERKPTTDPERLQELIEEATVDAYDDYEQHAGLLTMIEDNVVCPFKAHLIGEEIEVTEFVWPESGLGLSVQCTSKGKTHLVEVTSLEWTDPLPGVLPGSKPILNGARGCSG